MSNPSLVNDPVPLDEQEIENELLDDPHTQNSSSIFSMLKSLNENMQTMAQRLTTIERQAGRQAMSDDTEIKGRKRTSSGAFSDSYHELSNHSDDEESVALDNLIHSEKADPLTHSAEPVKQDDCLLSSIAQELTDQEATGPNINESLVAILNKRWSEKLSEKKLTEKLDRLVRPDNCSGLIVPRVNTEIWSKLQTISRRQDLRLANNQKTLSKAGSALIYNTEKLLNAREKDNTVDSADMIKSNMDILALLGHVFTDLSYRRREAIKPNLNREYAALCAPHVPITANLFGDDLQSELNTIKASNKIGHTAMGQRKYAKRKAFVSDKGESSSPNFFSRGKPWSNKGKLWFPKTQQQQQQQFRQRR